MEDIKIIVETLYRQALVLEAMSEGVGALMVLAGDAAKKCSDEECSRLMTMEIVEKGKGFCDRHYAESITGGETQPEDWTEISNCEHIRKIDSFLLTKSHLEGKETVH
jgi:hypothetical protein